MQRALSIPSHYHDHPSVVAAAAAAASSMNAANSVELDSFTGYAGVLHRRADLRSTTIPAQNADENEMKRNRSKILKFKIL
jgi:hypothetical protein